MVRRYLLPLTVLILSFSMLPAGVLAGGAASTCYPPLSLVTTSIPTATAGTSYSVALAGNGGQPPYFWSFGHSSLPKGFSINANGQVTGTPTKAGTYTFNVVLSDALKDNVTGALTLAVASAPTGTGGTTPGTTGTGTTTGTTGTGTTTGTTGTGTTTGTTGTGTTTGTTGTGTTTGTTGTGTTTGTTGTGTTTGTTGTGTTTGTTGTGTTTGTTGTGTTTGTTGTGTTTGTTGTGT
ncbi:MAG: Ig domain-containing protein, partial [Acidobacteriota bacterium]